MQLRKPGYKTSYCYDPNTTQMTNNSVRSKYPTTQDEKPLQGSRYQQELTRNQRMTIQ